MQRILFRRFGGFINLLKEIEICQTTVSFLVTLLVLYSAIFKRAHTAVTEKACDILHMCKRVVMLCGNEHCRLYYPEAERKLHPIHCAQRQLSPLNWDRQISQAYCTLRTDMVLMYCLCHEQL